jgi:hypothetical protein
LADKNVNSCGCCQIPKKRTPADLINAPGLSMLRYRVGTHSQFKADMSEAIAHKTALRNLTTREDDDLAIALIDAWATVADVLSFYQERIINEGYMRTATERRSVLELARTIGYELKPGVAANAPLAFVVEDAAGAPLQALVNEGTKVMSVPGQNEKLQNFETVEGIEAKAVLNDLRPLQEVPQQIKRGLKELYLKGLNNNLAPGDCILLVGSERFENPGNEQWDFRVLDTVTPNPDKNYTHITWKEGIGHGIPLINPAKKPQVFVFRQRAAFFGYNAPDWKAMPDSVKLAYDPQQSETGANGSRKIITVYPPHPPGLTDWPHFDKIKSDKSTIHLDAVYPKILDGSWIVLAGQHLRDGKSSYYVELYRAKKVEADAQADFTLSAKTTSIELDTDENLQETTQEGNVIAGFKRRETTIYCVNELLELSDEPITEPVYGNKITIDRRIPELKKGQKIIISGKKARVKIVEKRNMTIAPKDGLEEKDILQVLDPPTADVEGNVTWHLLNKKGLEVTVKVKPENIIPKDGLVTVNGNNLHLVSANGSRIKTLHGGQLGKNYKLTILKPLPAVDGFGNLSWTLRIEVMPEAKFPFSAFEGTVIDPSDRIMVVQSDKDDKTASDLVFIDDLSDESGNTEITLKIPEGKTVALQNVYDRATVHLYANIALATHGETVHETLGSGDGSQVNQQFQLRKPPLTYVSASTPSGIKSTLKVYVNNVQWQEATSTYDLAPNDQCYIVRIEDNGETKIYFGDGKAGTRLPSGTENVTAIYRSGIGLEGAVGANKLTLLQKRPFGIKSVTNPMAAYGAASPETLHDARKNAPLTVLTLDRIVSLKDYENFARTFSGIGKAQATAEWKGEENIIHLIIAAADAKQIDITSELYKNFLSAIEDVKAYGRKVSVESFTPVYFNVQGKIFVDPAYLPEEVKSNVQNALTNAFAFATRSFGQAVAESDVVAVIQAVPGVLYTDLDSLYLEGMGELDLKAFTVEPAMLLMINPKGINLEAKV